MSNCWELPQTPRRPALVTAFELRSWKTVGAVFALLQFNRENRYIGTLLIHVIFPLLSLSVFSPGFSLLEPHLTVTTISRHKPLHWCFIWLLKSFLRMKIKKKKSPKYLCSIPPSSEPFSVSIWKKNISGFLEPSPQVFHLYPKQLNISWGESLWKVPLSTSSLLRTGKELSNLGTLQEGKASGPTWPRRKS